MSHSAAPALPSSLAGWQQCGNSEWWICSRLALMQASSLTCSETRQAGFQRAFGVRNDCRPYKGIGVLSVLVVTNDRFPVLHCTHTSEDETAQACMSWWASLFSTFNYCETSVFKGPALWSEFGLTLANIKLDTLSWRRPIAALAS